MDRYNKANGVDAPPAVPPAADHPYYTSGDPQNDIPATTPGPWWFHMITESMRNVIIEAGLAPDHTDLDLFGEAIKALVVEGHGQCRLALTAGSLKLSPYNGNKLVINGVAQTVPSAGITLAVGALVAGSLYYIYAWMNAGVMTLEASATAHSVDASTGVEIKTGDASRTLVGMARPIAGPAFANARAQRFVRSWFNDTTIEGGNAFAATRTTTSVSFVELSSAERFEFLTWLNETVQLSTSGRMVNTGAGGYPADISIGLDNATPTDAWGSGISGSSPSHVPAASTVTISSLGEGYHYATILGASTQGVGVATYYGSGTPGTRTSISGVIGG